MRDPDSSRSIRAIWTGARLAVDLLVVVAWTVFVTVLFLETGWPRWAFYVLLLAGVLAYVLVTPLERR